MSHRLALLTIALLTFVVAISSGQDTAERLQKLLQRFPEADANKDGKLSSAEAQAYRAKAAGGAGQGAAAQKAAKKAKRAAATKPDHADVSYGPHPSNKL